MPKEIQFVAEIVDPDERGHCYHELKEFEGSFALISQSKEVREAVVFVHGFGGDAYGTWADFHLLVDQVDPVRSSFAEKDLYFFQYHSVWARIESSSNEFLKLVDILIPELNLEHFTADVSPVQFGLDESELVVPFPNARRYERVTLAGHSEGGVVIRTAIISRLTDAALLGCRVALFAPAISGYKPAGLLGMLANFPGLGAVMDAILSASPAYQDLKDTDFLLELRQKTEAAHGKGRALKAEILWGSKDYVVKPKKYDWDTQDFESRNHTEICKPSEHYLKPIDFIHA